jgi:hypothetical protein
MAHGVVPPVVDALGGIAVGAHSVGHTARGHGWGRTIRTAAAAAGGERGGGGGVDIRVVKFEVVLIGSRG